MVEPTLSVGAGAIQSLPKAGVAALLLHPGVQDARVRKIQLSRVGRLTSPNARCGSGGGSGGGGSPPSTKHLAQHVRLVVSVTHVGVSEPWSAGECAAETLALTEQAPSADRRSGRRF